jgi:hypothetical protein
MAGQGYGGQIVSAQSQRYSNLLLCELPVLAFLFGSGRIFQKTDEILFWNLFTRGAFFKTGL